MVLLISTYDLGRQSFGLASAAAALKAEGHDVVCVDLAKQKVDPDAIVRAEAIAFFLPMHTATRLAVPVMQRVRTLNPSARLIAYGLYAPLNAPLLRECGVATIIGGEFEDALARAVNPAGSGAVSPVPESAAPVPRVTFRVPDRTGLLPLARYATLQAGRERRLAGYTEASRGCKHLCRHCPIVPVYGGRFRVVPIDVVIADIAAQVAAGARHITFGDPDFFNGIKHASAVLDAFARQFPGTSYDVTIKVEHLIEHEDRLPMLVQTGCAFVTSAIESVDDRMLAALEKGHTRADFERVAVRFREIGLALSPTFVAFTPWTTLDGYCDLLQTIDRLELVDHVAPIQLAIRLLVTEGSRLLELRGIRDVLKPFNARSLTYPWAHADPRVDDLQKAIEAIAGVTLSAPRPDVFARVWDLAHAAAGIESTMRAQPPLASRATIPYLNEPWYC
ncbi:MAG TPA: CUAEP/CCAEP-tail radical SAM protein [Vicinamibacterales bacterium]